ncbi:hypothetical protein QBC47DRAFT_381406 [Echria macrotheca]|uniref:NACHT domain-containing protein n=1 Tax=Echria macrotheca TaxID=438768 RepID=A0AAJ0BH85_9PEZI|nr:hypothetical protein QBC47DRAFT_381406 [Echria macrotheca]
MMAARRYEASSQQLFANLGASCLGDGIQFIAPRDIQNNPIPNSLTQTREEVLAELPEVRYLDRKNINPKPVPGTCVWFVNHPLFRQWRESKESGVLWVSADPGCGKSVLARHLVDSVLTKGPNPPTVCYFFFKDGIPEQQDLVQALRCILHQLFTQAPHLLSQELIRRFKTGGQILKKSSGELWNILMRASENASAGEIICLFDAIDECENRGSQLIKELCELCRHTTAASNSRLKFLLTSRPFEAINLGLQPRDVPNLPIIHLSGETGPEMEAISQEIDLFIKARVENIGKSRRLTADEQSQLLERLLGVGNRTYLWVYLTLDLVEKTILLDKSISDVTDRLPETVESAYDRILSNSSDRVMALKVLQIVTAAVRPLTVKEMSVALALQRGPGSELDIAPEERVGKDVREACGLFVMVIDSKIHLLHQTAREFLVRNLDTATLPMEDRAFTWKHSIWPEESHLMLAKTCIQYLLLPGLELDPLGQGESLSQYTERRIFLDYSAKNWATHTRELTAETQCALNPSVLAICDTNSTRFSTWLRVYWSSLPTEFPEGFTTLMAASYFGLEMTVKHLLRTAKGDDLDARDQVHERTALSWAAGEGHYAVTKLLVSGVQSIPMRFIQPFWRGSRINSLDKYGRPPLSYAVWSGNTKVVKLLVKKGAQVDLEDDIGGTPLSYAVCGGHQEIIKILLERGVEIGSEAEILRDLLFSATSYGDHAVVKMLLETAKVDPNTQNEYGWIPLIIASTMGNLQILRIFLRNSADVNAETPGIGRPLDHAIHKGDEECVKAILERKPELNYCSFFARCRLFAECPLIGGCPLFSGCPLFPPSFDRRKQSPLVLAVLHEQKAITKLLLEHGAAPDFKGSGSHSPFQLAQEMGQHELTELMKPYMSSP